MTLSDIITSSFCHYSEHVVFILLTQITLNLNKGNTAVYRAVSPVDGLALLPNQPGTAACVIECFGLQLF